MTEADIRLQTQTSSPTSSLTTDLRSQCSLAGDLTTDTRASKNTPTYDAATRDQSLISEFASPISTYTSVSSTSRSSNLRSSTSKLSSSIPIEKKRLIESFNETQLASKYKKSRIARKTDSDHNISDGEAIKTSLTQQELREEISLAISHGQTDLQKYERMSGSKRFKDNPTKFTFQGRLRKEFRVGGPKSTAPKRKTKLPTTQIRSDAEVLDLYLEVGIHKRAALEPAVFDWRGLFRQSYKDAMLTKWRQAKSLSHEDIVAIYHILDIDKRIELAPDEFSAEGELISGSPKIEISSRRSSRPQTRSQYQTDCATFSKDHDRHSNEHTFKIDARVPAHHKVFSAPGLEETVPSVHLGDFEDFAI